MSATEAAARLLLNARGDHRRLPELPGDCRPADDASGYAIQDMVVDSLAVERAGFKIGCTSDEACRIMNADGPFAGTLFAATTVPSPAELSAGAFHMRGLEGEFAFELAEDLPPRGAPYAADDIPSAIACLYPAIEIVDSRFQDWLSVGIPSVIADNAVHGALVLGAPVTGWQSTDLSHVGARMRVNGEEVRSGTGADVMGHPLNALAWIANHRAAAGGLRAGEIVTTGTLTGIVFVEAGDRAVADFGELGAAELKFGD